MVLLKIDNYDEVQNQYSVSDINLIKYGIKNICSEIFENNGLMIKPAENSSDRIEFVVGLKSKQDKKAVNDAIYKCMKSIDNYIGFKLSGFIKRRPACLVFGHGSGNSKYTLSNTASGKASNSKRTSSS